VSEARNSQTCSELEIIPSQLLVTGTVGKGTVRRGLDLVKGRWRGDLNS